MRERNDEGVLGTLLEQIEEYSKKGVYPFHMPGHKRNGEGMLPFFAQWFERDFTEIPDWMICMHRKGSFGRRRRGQLPYMVRSRVSFW